VFTISLEDMLDQSILKTIGISKFHYNIAQFSRNSIMILVDNIFLNISQGAKAADFTLSSNVATEISSIRAKLIETQSSTILE